MTPAQRVPPILAVPFMPRIDIPFSGEKETRKRKWCRMTGRFVKMPESQSEGAAGNGRRYPRFRGESAIVCGG